MNYVYNDKEELVIAMGAPGSIERAISEYPKLIEIINETDNIAIALTLVKAKGISSQLEVESILMASNHRHSVEGHGQYY